MCDCVEWCRLEVLFFFFQLHLAGRLTTGGNVPWHATPSRRRRRRHKQSRKPKMAIAATCLTADSRPSPRHGHINMIVDGVGGVSVAKEAQFIVVLGQTRQQWRQRLGFRHRARRPSLPPVKTQKRHSVVGLGLGPLIGHSLPKSREGDDVVNTNYHSAPRSIVEVVR